jgi:hypothetical protein
LARPPILKKWWMRWVNLKIKPMKALFDGGVDESVESAIAIKLGVFSARPPILKKTVDAPD